MAVSICPGRADIWRKRLHSHLWLATRLRPEHCLTLPGLVTNGYPPESENIQNAESKRLLQLRGC